MGLPWVCSKDRIATLRLVCLAAMAILSTVPATAFAQQPSVPASATGAQLYTAACANCHGREGTGAPASQVGFTDPLPNFTDCAYSAGETAADWGALVHEGGRVRSLSHRMPQFGAALSAEQIERVVAYVRSLCTDKRWPKGELNLPRPMETEKAFPENETVLTSDAVTKAGERSASATIHYERRFGALNQWELAIPIVIRERTAGEGTGWLGPRLGDIEFAVKRVLYHNADRGSILSLNTEVALPTGSERLGFGSGTAAVEPTLLGAQILPADAFVHFQTGVEFPLKAKKGDPEALFRAALGRSFGSAYGRSWTPMLEFLGSRELADGAHTEWDFIPHMEVTLSKRQHVAISGGMRLPLTDRADRPKTFVAYFIWDWYDGGLFEGW